MAHLNELPPCVLVTIFSYLPIGEVIRLKLVCKVWREISCYVPVKSLSIYQSGIKNLDRRKSCLVNFDLYVNDLEKFIEFTGWLTNGLKRLHCHFSAPVTNGQDQMQDFLNRFKRLEELELFMSGDLEHSVIKLILEFERLRKLILICDRRTFELNCPELSYLDVTTNFEDCLIRYPEKLRTLVTFSNDSYQSGSIRKSVNEGHLKKFTNLKNLIAFLHMEDPNLFAREFFEGLPKSLQRLIFSEQTLWFSNQKNEINLDDHFRTQYRIDQEDSLGLRVFYLGIQLDPSRFTSAGRKRLPKNAYDKNFPNFLVDNLANSVDANLSIGYIDYNALDKLLPTFDQLHEKIYLARPNCCINLKETVNDQERLLEFIRMARSYYMIFDSLAVFPRPFFDRLAEVCTSSLKMIDINAAKLSGKPDALDFLLKMAELKMISISNSHMLVIARLDFVILAFEKMKNLNTFFFGWLTFLQTNHSSGVLMIFYYTEPGDWKEIFIDFPEDENGLDALRSMVARMKRRDPMAFTPEQSNMKDLDYLVVMAKRLQRKHKMLRRMKRLRRLKPFFSVQVIYRVIRSVRRRMGLKAQSDHK